MIRALRSNRCVTRRRPRDENHAIKFGQSTENCNWAWDTQPIRVSLTSLQEGTSIGTPWLLEETKRRRSPLSEYMSLHPSLTHHRNINPFKNKVWEIYFYKEVCLFVRSLKFVNYVWLCFRLYLYVGIQHQFWSSRLCEVLLYCHYSQVHSHSEW